jgi:phosphoribosyl 1,2-cyclic phosphate phosphodiesterase
VIPAYAGPETHQDLRRIFDYISTESQPGFYRPQIDFRVFDGVVQMGDVSVEPLPVVHGPRETNGILFCCGHVRFAYLPDCKTIPAATLERIRGVDVVVLDALRHRQHVTHMTVEESLGCLSEIGAKRAYLIHMCHELSHRDLEASLPSDVYASYDGLIVTLAG